MLKNRYYSFIRKKDLLKTLLDEATTGLTKPKIEESEDCEPIKVEETQIKVEAKAETTERSFITAKKVYDFENVEFVTSLFGIMAPQEEELHTRITPMQIPVFEPSTGPTNYQHNQYPWMMQGQFAYYSEYGMSRF
jgi:hypothetical protein